MAICSKCRHPFDCGQHWCGAVCDYSLYHTPAEDAAHRITCNFGLCPICFAQEHPPFMDSMNKQTKSLFGR